MGLNLCNEKTNLDLTDNLLALSASHLLNLYFTCHEQLGIGNSTFITQAINPLYTNEFFHLVRSKEPVMVHSTYQWVQIDSSTDIL